MTDKITNLVTPVGRFSYPNLAKPKADLSGDLKYSVDLLFEKTKADKDPLFLAIKKATEDALIQQFGALTPELHRAIKDGDQKLRASGEPNETYAGMYYITFKSSRPIPVVDANKRLLDFVSDEMALVGGDYGRAQINGNIKAYSKSKTVRGVSVFATQIQLTGKTDQPFSSGSFNPDDFDKVPF